MQPGLGVLWHGDLRYLSHERERLSDGDACSEVAEDAQAVLFQSCGDLLVFARMLTLREVETSQTRLLAGWVVMSGPSEVGGLGSGIEDVLVEPGRDAEPVCGRVACDKDALAQWR